LKQSRIAMWLVISIFIGVAVVLLAGLGAVRGLQRGILALMATLLGVVLADLWATNLSPGLVTNLEFERSEATGLISSTLLLCTSLLIGYGGGILLVPAPKRMSAAMRAAGATLGLLNAIVLFGFLLKYATSGSPDFRDAISNSPLATILLEGLPAFVLAASSMAALFIVGVQVTRMARARQTPVSAQPSVRPTPATPAPGSAIPRAAAPSQPPPTPTPTVRQQQRDILNKVDERIKENEQRK
jgi:uncharacterized membrane protein required for colicin V production